MYCFFWNDPFALSCDTILPQATYYTKKPEETTTSQHIWLNTEVLRKIPLTTHYLDLTSDWRKVTQSLQSDKSHHIGSILTIRSLYSHYQMIRLVPLRTLYTSQSIHVALSNNRSPSSPRDVDFRWAGASSWRGGWDVRRQGCPEGQVH